MKGTPDDETPAIAEGEAAQTTSIGAAGTLATERSPQSGNRLDLAFFLILAAGVTIRFLALDQQSFEWDEVESVTMRWRGGDAGLLTVLRDPHGPIYLALLKGWMTVFGQADGAVRTLSAVLGSVGLVLFYRIALPLVGRATALVGLALLASSPFYLYYSQWARGYALVFDLGLLAVPAFVADVKRRTPGTFLTAFLTTLAACLANLTGFFLLVLHAVYALAVGRRSHYPIRRLLLFLVLAGAILWPWAMRATGSTADLSLGRPDEGSGVRIAKGDSPPGLLSIPFTFYNFSLGYSVGPSITELKIHRFPAARPHLWYLIPIGVLFVLAALQGARRVSRSTLPLLVTWVAVPVLLMAGLSALNLKAPNARYAILAFAPYLLLVAAGVTSIGNRALRTALLCVLLLFSAYADYQYFTNPRYWRPDVRSAGELITRQAKPDDVVVFYTLGYPKYYFGRDIDYVKPMPRDFASERAMERWLRSNTKDKSRVWLVQCFSWWIDREDKLLHLCQRVMIPAGEWQFTELPVYLFEKPGDWESRDSAGEAAREPTRDPPSAQ